MVKKYYIKTKSCHLSIKVKKKKNLLAIFLILKSEIRKIYI